MSNFSKASANFATSVAKLREWHIEPPSAVVVAAAAALRVVVECELCGGVRERIEERKAVVRLRLQLKTRLAAEPRVLLTPFAASTTRPRTSKATVAAFKLGSETASPHHSIVNLVSTYCSDGSNMRAPALLLDTTDYTRRPGAFKGRRRL